MLSDTRRLTTRCSATAIRWLLSGPLFAVVLLLQAPGVIADTFFVTAGIERIEQTYVVIEGTHYALVDRELTPDLWREYGTETQVVYDGQSRSLDTIRAVGYVLPTARTLIEDGVVRRIEILELHQ